MTPAVKEKLTALLPGRVKFDASLAEMTTFGLGGPAETLAEPDSPEELAGLLGLVRAELLPSFILGGGSNVLFRDGGFPGVVIRLGRGFADLKTIAGEGDEVLIEAGAAAATAALVRLTRRQGLSGLEFMAGLPGWVGGALAMNAGTREAGIVDAVQRLEIMASDLEVRRLEKGEIKSRYRGLDLPEGAVILKAVFGLKRGRPELVEAKVLEVLAARRASQPRGVKSAGCVFKNPPGEAAGRLIDRAGLKGRRKGGAWVAEEHANFIVHRGQATAGQVIGLLEEVRTVVREKFAVELEPEIKIVGRDPQGAIG
ncbi:MAG: UDP-N-acetylmuramate dehydrogenase [Thermodesulfobacteriota bacterium]